MTWDDPGLLTVLSLRAASVQGKRGSGVDSLIQWPVPAGVMKSGGASRKGSKGCRCHRPQRCSGNGFCPGSLGFRSHMKDQRERESERERERASERERERQSNAAKDSPEQNIRIKQKKAFTKSDIKRPRADFQPHPMGFSSILFRQAEANSFAVLETEGAEYGVDKSNGKHSIQQLEDQSRSLSPCFVKYITRRDIATKQVGGGSLVCLGRANILFFIIQRGPV